MTILEAALRSLLLACAVWAGLRAFRVRNVIAQKAAWGLVLATALLMPALMRWQSFLPGLAVTLPANPMAAFQAKPVVTPAPARMTQAVLPATEAPEVRVPVAAHHVYPSSKSVAVAPAQSFDAATPVDMPAAQLPLVYTGSPAPTAEQARPTQPRAISWIFVAVMLYFGVAAALLVRLFYGLVCAYRLWRWAEPIQTGEVLDSASGLSLRASTAVSSPVTIGLSIVLPADYSTWDAEKLRIVVAHERSHIRQGDFYVQLLAGLYAALVWFSPLGWWLKRELSDLAETISDRAGLEQAASSTSYAQILLEFAAAPRPAALGVAMARPGSLSRRIERLLNDNAFRQAFAGGRRRALIAVLLVPVALYAATALVRVQAAQDVQATPAAKPEIAAQSAPQAKPSPAHPADAEQPAGDAFDEDAPRVIVIPAIPKVVVPPLPRIAVVVPKIPPIPAVTIPKIVIPPMSPIAVAAMNGRAFALLQDDEAKADRHHGYRYSIDGDSYAIIRGDRGDTMNFSGEMHTGDIDKARKLAHGDFLWFERDDKQYYVDDPATIAQIEAMYKPIDDLGKQQEELGRQQEVLGKQQEELGRQQEQASLPAPDMQKEMAEIDAAMAKLKAKMGQNITQDELGDLQNKLGDLQGRLGDLQGKIGEQQGKLGEQQGKLGEQQGRLGEQQGKLGEEQGRLSRDADRKVHGIMEESLRNGKAHLIN